MTTPDTPAPNAPRSSLWEIISRYPTQPLELLGGVSAVLRGFWIILYAGQVHSFAVAQYLESLAPVPLWGLSVLAAGAIQLIALERRDVRLRQIASFALVILVGLMLCGYLLYQRQDIGVPLYTTMFLKQLWIGSRSRSHWGFNQTQAPRRAEPYGNS